MKFISKFLLTLGSIVILASSLTACYTVNGVGNDISAASGPYVPYNYYRDYGYYDGSYVYKCHGCYTLYKYCHSACYNGLCDGYYDYY